MTNKSSPTFIMEDLDSSYFDINFTDIYSYHNADDIQPVYMLHHLVASLILQLSSILTNATLLVVIVSKPELRSVQNKWLFVAFAGTMICGHILGIITETDNKLSTSVIDRKLCTVVFVLQSILNKQIRYIVILINIAAIVKALGKELSKVVTACFIFGSIIISIIHIVIFIFGVGNGFHEYPEMYFPDAHARKRCIYVINDLPRKAVMVDIVLGDILYPGLLLTFVVLFTIFYKRGFDQATRGHHLSVLLGDLTLFVMTLPGSVVLVHLNFTHIIAYNHNEDMWYILSYISLLSLLLAPLIWLWVCPRMRSAYRQICCCCCCPQKPQDAEEMVLLE